MAFAILLSCSKDKTVNNNPFLPNYSFSVNVDTNLPTNSNLNFAGNGVRVFQQGIGVTGGIIVFNTGTGYNAYDVACPNQSVSTCSILTLDGINAVCACDSKSYSLFTGLAANSQYPLKGYRVEVLGSVIRVYN